MMLLNIAIFNCLTTNFQTRQIKNEEENKTKYSSRIHIEMPDMLRTIAMDEKNSMRRKNKNYIKKKKNQIEEKHIFIF